MDDKFLASAVAKMKTEALSAASAAAPAPSASASAALKGQLPGAAGNSSAAGTVCAPLHIVVTQLLQHLLHGT